MVTIREVADRAGVSTSTVSRTLAGGEKVNAATRARVQEAVASLGYQPNQAARTLRRKRSDTIGVIVPDIENPHFTRSLRVIEDAAFRQGYRVILCNTDETPAKQRAYLEVLAAEQVVGVILAPADARDPTVSHVIDAGIPVVALDRSVDDERADAVFADNRSAVVMATEHLLARGYRSLAFVAGRPEIQTGRERLDGFAEVMARNGWPCLVAEGEFRLEMARQAVIDLLTTHPEVDGIVIANNLMAIGTLEALRACGRTVPGDVALIAIDDPPWARLVAPAMTTLGQPTQEMATRAFELLLDRISGKRTMSRFEVFRFQLNVRESCGSSTIVHAGPADRPAHG